MWKICFLSLLLLSTVACQAKVPGTTLPKTIALPALVRISDLPLFKLPASVTTISPASSQNCPSVWPAQKTNCKISPLISYQTIETTELSSSVSSNKALVKNIGPRVQLATEYTKAMSSIRRRLLQEGGISIQQANQALTLLAPFRNSALLSNFNDSINTCWSFLEKARNATLCYICSNQNSQYFLNGKAIVSQSDCGKMVTACLNYFDFSSTLLLSSEQFVKSTNTWNARPSFGANITQLSGFVTSLANLMVKSNLKSLLTSYKVQTGDDKIRTSNQVCARILRLHQSQLFDSMDQILLIVNFLVKEISRTATIDDYPPKLRLAVKSRFEPSSSSQTDRRLLQDTSSTENNPFEGDVAVVQSIDNMFVSFDGAQGTSLGTGNTAYTPMNLTTCFP